MRLILWLLVLAALAVGLSLAARYNDGYVLLVVPPWRAELSLNLLVLVLLAMFALAHGLLSAVRHTLSLPRSVAEFRRQRRRDKADADMQKATRLLAEGRYGHAMRHAERAWTDHPYAGMVALVGWRAAHAMREHAQTRVWRDRALAAGGGLEVACLMTDAELALDDRRFDDARAALQSLARHGGRHIASLRLALRAEQGVGHWAEVARLVRQLEKVRALTAEQAAPLRQRAVREVLRSLADDLPGLQKFWASLDDAERAAPALALATAQALAAAGDCREAQRVIEDALEERWDESLVRAYAECNGGDILGRIARAEKWLTTRPRDENLLLCLGRLCRTQQLWGKARSFLEASIAIQASPEAHLELARLLEEELQDSALAGRHYRAAALLAGKAPA